jgi:predicted Zn-dependent protease
MGHEIAHALARHGAERMAQHQLVKVGQVAAASSLGGESPEQQRMVMAALGLGAQYGMLLPYSRSHESEADHIGLLLMAVGGYEPEESVRFWARMEKAGGSRPPEFLSTHPDAGRRQQNLRRWLNEAIPLYEQSRRQPNRPLSQNEN